jgi:hypothetical protein
MSQHKNITIHGGFSSDEHTDINSFIKEIQFFLLDNKAKNGKITFYCGEYECDIELSCVRLENDKELESRLNREQWQRNIDNDTKAQKQAERRKKYEELKKEFEQP